MLSYLLKLALDDPVGEAVGEGCNRQARVRADRTGHHRPIGNVKTRVVKYLPIGIHHPFVLIPPHRATAELVYGDYAAEIPDRIILELRSQGFGNILHRIPETIEVGAGSTDSPINVELVFLQLHVAVRNVSPHAEQGQ